MTPGRIRWRCCCLAAALIAGPPSDVPWRGLGPRCADAQLVILNGEGCTRDGDDAYRTGAHVGCCAGLELCDGDDAGTPRRLCLPSCEQSGSAAARGHAAAEREPTCADQWDNVACKGQFGNQQCATCGERIDYMRRDMNMPLEEAKEQVGQQFFGKCGACIRDRANLALADENYTVVWRDDFDGEGGVNSSTWTMVHSHGNGFGNKELQFYTDRADNALQSGGTLKLIARREEFMSRRFTSAKLESRAGWVYGKVSARVRLAEATARGSWAAVWLMPVEDSYGPWPQSGEIDIMEHVGYLLGTIHGTAHTGRNNHMLGTQVGGQTKVDVARWVTYTMEWRPDVILFAADGQVYQVFKKSSDDPQQWPFDKPFHLILNMAVGGEWGGAQGIDEGAFYGDGQAMEVDWIKVEQREY